ncbi:hypothetical protein E2C01_029803 [Portunus trituberculatus]|uniref:Uncharacterized protein n=1 Tax=Portunus trituberculatus TaxID=210409 RepID=A0A5B7ET73_PORTR|nr:hypothetical protein [Portunus trituberculatus]
MRGAPGKAIPRLNIRSDLIITKHINDSTPHSVTAGRGKRSSYTISYELQVPIVPVGILKEYEKCCPASTH